MSYFCDITALQAYATIIGKLEQQMDGSAELTNDATAAYAPPPSFPDHGNNSAVWCVEYKMC
jgi:hypothetical protein